MTVLDHSSVEALVEAICQKGCLRVRRDIAVLESGADLPETLGLDPSERQALLRELKDIMAVYGESCRLD
ncbi:hypothetical protein [Imhoffiella purpurea]|uniref:Uncharacterized protein n=1 Tax=Imhoffiella purpurea TaxID=1249627 RepID=W9V419_9GAMM|nr:hypothetical protein [Imhoffiella purpurea]EXJ14268.1 hypothetical protein D779_2806 [Imhoffiella purpurea]